MTPRQPGRIITFYSYKGGTGRSMALSNVAWLLAAAGKSVLLIDWDLEAPGLHRYFKPFLIDHELSSSNGLMDLIDNYACEAIRPLPEGETLAPDWWLPLVNLTEYVLPVDFEHFPSGGRIDLLTAGRQSSAYAVKVNAFNWQNFYDRLGGGGFLEGVKAAAAAEYDYILIDSRTGVSDTAGICTAQMPDTLVVCFTYNNQSIKGTQAVAASAIAQHAEIARRMQKQVAPDPTGVLQYSPRPYRVFPIPMRADNSESDRLALRQNFARDAFSTIVDANNDIRDKAQYWPLVEVPYWPVYAYEEVLSPLKDDPHNHKSVLYAFIQVTSYLTGGEVSEYNLPLEPALRQRYVDAFAETPQSAAARQASIEAAKENKEQALVRRANEAINTMDDSQKAIARSVLCRLVRIGKSDEGGRHYPIRVASSDISKGQLQIVETLARHGILVVSAEQRGTTNQKGGAEQIVSFADDRFVVLWSTLQRWLEEDREFLLWRQQLRDYRNDWARIGESSALLSGTLLGEARIWARTRLEDLNDLEREFIEASIAAAEFESTPKREPTRATRAELPKSTRRAWLTPVFVILAIAISLGLFSFQMNKREVVALAPTSPLSVQASLAGTPAPQLVGTSPDQARTIAKALGFTLTMFDEDTKVEQFFSEGVITDQKPVARELVLPGTVLRVNVTTKTKVVPLVVGQQLGSALEILQRGGLKLETGPSISTFDAKTAPGTIVNQSPDPGTKVRAGSIVTVRITDKPALNLEKLKGYKIAIFFYAGDQRGIELASLIATHLRKTGFSGFIENRPSTEQRMKELYPPRTVEVRYEDGSENGPADALQSLLQQADGLGEVRKFVVKNSTPRYLSIFIPRSGKTEE